MIKNEKKSLEKLMEKQKFFAKRVYRKPNQSQIQRHDKASLWPKGNAISLYVLID